MNDEDVVQGVVENPFRKVRKMRNNCMFRRNIRLFLTRVVYCLDVPRIILKENSFRRDIIRKPRGTNNGLVLVTRYTPQYNTDDLTLS